MNSKSSQPKVSEEEDILCHNTVAQVFQPFVFFRFRPDGLCYSDSASLAGSVSISFVNRLPCSLLASMVALASLVV